MSEPGAIARLGAYDEHCLRVERPARPGHLGMLAIVEAAPLLDRDGRLRLGPVRQAVLEGLLRVPPLRRVACRAGPLAGGQIWVDDPAFRIEDHVAEVNLAAPASEATVLETVEQLLARPLDRARPLWRIWLVTGIEGDRVGVLVTIHHALADGLAAMRLIRPLLASPLADDGAQGTSLPAPGRRPGWGRLVRDNVRRRLGALRAAAHPSTWRFALGVVRAMWLVSARARRTPISSLNGPVGPRRRLALIRLDPRAAKRIARAAGCGVNDVILDVVAGGLRALLAGRGESVARLRPRVGLAVALYRRPSDLEPGNDVGSLLVPLPLDDPDPVTRLAAIAHERARAKESPMVAAEPLLRAWLGRWGWFRRSLERQRLVNLAATFVPGPPRPIPVLGTRIVDLVPIAPLAANLGLSVVALTYAGRLTIAVRADADAFPDLAVLVAAMERDWAALAAPRA